MADAESRQSFEPSDWKLHKGVFDQLQKVWGPHNVDLFAARHNRQFNCLVISASNLTRKQRQWMALAQCWSDLRAYAFYPFALIGWCLQKLEQEQVKELVLMVPVRHNQTWFPALLTKPHRPADLVARLQQDHHKSSWGDTPIYREKQLASGHLQSFRSSIQEQGISDESFRIISAAWRERHVKFLFISMGESGYFGVGRTNTIPFPMPVFRLFDWPVSWRQTVYYAQFLSISAFGHSSPHWWETGWATSNCLSFVTGDVQRMSPAPR